jgi:hypothetical protein
MLLWRQLDWQVRGCATSFDQAEIVYTEHLPHPSLSLITSINSRSPPQELLQRTNYILILYRRAYTHSIHPHIVGVLEVLLPSGLLPTIGSIAVLISSSANPNDIPVTNTSHFIHRFTPH